MYAPTHDLLIRSILRSLIRCSLFLSLNFSLSHTYTHTFSSFLFFSLSPFLFLPFYVSLSLSLFHSLCYSHRDLSPFTFSSIRSEGKASALSHTLSISLPPSQFLHFLHLTVALVPTLSASYELNIKGKDVRFRTLYLTSQHYLYLALTISRNVKSAKLIQEVCHGISLK